MKYDPAKQDDYLWLLLRREFLDAVDDLGAILHETYDGMVLCGPLRVSADNEGGVRFAMSDAWTPALRWGVTSCPVN